LPMATTRTRARRATVSPPATPTSPVPGLVQAALEDMKAVNVKVMDVRGLTDIADTLIIASGNSDRHVRSIADRVVQSAKAAGYRPFGVEGARDGEWALVDLHDVIVHVMLPRVREFYGLERLWGTAETPVAPPVAAPRKRTVRKPKA
jgi:ribosome-associated protein